MLTNKEVKFLREELVTAKNPLFFYDADADGLCAFLLLYKLQNEGTGIVVKSAPKVDLKFIRKVKELNPDKIFILDIPIVNQNFIDKAKRPTFWLDHHQPLKRNKIHYFNPRIKNPDIYLPTTRMAYQINDNEENLWLATIGCLGDYSMPDFIDQFVEKYPHLLSEKADLDAALYKEPVGELVKMFFFLLKGPTLEVRKSVKILMKIQSPDEILKKETAQGKFLYKRFKSINQKYQILLKEAKKEATGSKLLLYYYTENQWSFTANLANELIVNYPNKVVLIARNKSGEMKCSLRAKFPIAKALEKSLVGVEGYGGGHPNACGAVIKEEDWDRFLENFKAEIKELGDS